METQSLALKRPGLGVEAGGGREGKLSPAPWCFESSKLPSAFCYGAIHACCQVKTLSRACPAFNLFNHVKTVGWLRLLKAADDLL